MGSNVQALLMAAAAGGGGGGSVTWNPSDKGTDVILSNGDLTATTVSGTSANVRATISYSTGKFYWEVVIDTVDAPDTSPTIGVCVAATLFTNSLYYGQPTNYSSISVNGYTFLNGGYKGSGVTLTTGDRVNVAVDLGANKIWYGKNGAWILSGNPGAGTSETWTLTANTYFPVVRVYGTPVITAHFSSGSWTDSAPSGFGAWT